MSGYMCEHCKQRVEAGHSCKCRGSGMMSEKNDGGAAFPLVGEASSGRLDCLHNGMSLRDWFAGQVLAGWVSDPQVEITTGTVGNIAMYCYELADAMIAARGGQQ